MELRESLYRIENRQENLFRLSLDACHYIYRAHFPSMPVTPGVIIVQIAVELAELCLGRRLRIKAVRNVKFTSVISPVETPSVDFEITKVEEDGNCVKVQVEVRRDETIFAKISLALE